METVTGSFTPKTQAERMTYWAGRDEAQRCKSSLTHEQFEDRCVGYFDHAGKPDHGGVRYIWTES